MPRGVTYTASAFFTEYAGVDARVSKFVDRDSAISNAPMSHSVERSSLIHIWVPDPTRPPRPYYFLWNDKLNLFL